MDLYLPIANISVNALAIILLGGAVGILSGMFGLGGGFLTTPILIFFGIPPAVAAASASSQLTGASVSGVIAHLRRGGVDLKMGWILVVGGILGSFFGAFLFRMLQNIGQIDTVINILYVVLLLLVGVAMARSAWHAIAAQHSGEAIPVRSRHHHRLVVSLPFRWRFYASGIYLSPLAPLILGFITGIATELLGVGGGFILIPAKVYLFGMRAKVVAGTSLFQILFVTATATMVNALTTHSVDVVLAGLLLIGSVVGAQVGTRFAERVPPDYMRLGLAVLILLVALRLVIGLGIHPDEIYTVEVTR